MMSNVPDGPKIKNNNLIYGRNIMYVQLRSLQNNDIVQGVHLILCFFPKILECLPTLPLQHSADIGCTKNYQPIGVTKHSH